MQLFIYLNYIYHLPLLYLYRRFPHSPFPIFYSSCSRSRESEFLAWRREKGKEEGVVDDAGRERERERERERSRRGGDGGIKEDR